MTCLAAYTLSETEAPGNSVLESYCSSFTEVAPPGFVEVYVESQTRTQKLLASYTQSNTSVVTQEYATYFPVVPVTPPVTPVIPVPSDYGVILPFEPPVQAGWPSRLIDHSYTVEQCFFPEDKVEIRFNGNDITDYVKDLDISGTNGRGVTGNLVLSDHDEKFIKQLNQFNPITNSSIKTHNMTTSSTLTLDLRMGQSIRPIYPTFIPGDPRKGADGTVSWAFTDMMPIASKENQSIPDTLYDEGDDETAFGIVAKLAALIGVTIQCRFRDFRIRTFRFNQGNVLNAIDEICSVTQSYKRWEGKVLVLEPLKTMGSGTHIVDRFHIPQNNGIDIGHDTSGLKTLFKAFRMAPLPTTLAAPIDCSGGQCVGRVVQINFQKPTTYAYIIAHARDGQVKDGVFYSEDGTPLNNTPDFRYFGTADKKASYWIGTYFPRFTRLEAYVPYWRVEAYGGSNRGSTIDGFTYQEIVGAAEAIFGRRPEYKNLETEVILDPSTAQAMLKAIATEVEWGVIKGSLNIRHLIREGLGDLIRVSDYEHGLNNRLFSIESFSHRWNPRDGFTNNMGIRGSL